MYELHLKLRIYSIYRHKEGRDELPTEVPNFADPVPKHLM